MRREHHMMNEEDPRLTAYVLGETDGEDSAQVEQCLSEDAGFRDAERELREMAEGLRAELAEPSLMLDPVRRAELYSRLGRGDGEAVWWKRAAVVSGMAACICVGISVGLLLPSLGRWSGVPAGVKLAKSGAKEGGGLLSFGFHLESEKGGAGEWAEAFGSDMTRGIVQEPEFKRESGTTYLAGGAPRKVASLPESSNNLGRVPENILSEKPLASSGKLGLEKGGGAGSDSARRPAVAAKKPVAVPETGSGVSRVVAVQGGKGHSPVWGGQDPASRQRAAQSLESVSGALNQGRWPEPGSFTTAGLVSAYADLTGTAGGRMDFRFAAAVASFGTLLEKPEGADSRRWEEVLEMAGGTGSAGGVRQGFLGLVESARRLAGQGVEKR